MRYLAATDGDQTNEVLLEYLEPRLRPADTVHVVQSFEGQGEAAVVEEDSDKYVRGREALDGLAERLGESADVRTHQLARGNEPHEDVLQFAREHDVDEIVLGIRQRSGTKRALFGSTAEAVLQGADRPVVALPLPDS